MPAGALADASCEYGLCGLPGVRGPPAGSPALVRAGVVSRPGLFERLGASARVTVVSAPPGSGKTVLLRSWIGEPGLAGSVAWVAVGRDERDPQRFWLSVLGALRGTSAGSALVRELTAAPDLDGWAIVERLLKDLAPLEDRLWLVIDDVHELGSAEALRQLELLVMRAPPELRFVLATRHDLRLGLHRLRLEGELTEIRAADLRFTRGRGAGAARRRPGWTLPEPALAMLHERAEGWAAGLRLAALSLAGHPDPERFAAEFSGSERTVAEYLLAEVLERQRDEVRRLLLRTSVLERVTGPLADALTGGSGGERMLAGAGGGERVRGIAGRGAVLVPLPPPVRRPAAAGAAAHRAGRGHRAARGSSRVVRGARVPGGGDPPRPGGAGLGPGRPAARRSLARPAPGRAGRHRARAPGRVPRRGPRGGCRAGRGGCGR